MTDQPDEQPTEQPTETFDGLWKEAIENHVAAMSPADFNAMVSRTRPSTPSQPQDPQEPLAGINGHSDPADRRRALLASIQGKQQRHKRPVDANGNPDRGPINAAPPAMGYIGKLQPGAYPNQQTRRTETDGI